MSLPPTDSYAEVLGHGPSEQELYSETGPLKRWSVFTEALRAGCNHCGCSPDLRRGDWDTDTRRAVKTQKGSGRCRPRRRASEDTGPATPGSGTSRLQDCEEKTACRPACGPLSWRPEHQASAPAEPLTETEGMLAKYPLPAPPPAIGGVPSSSPGAAALPSLSDKGGHWGRGREEAKEPYFDSGALRFQIPYPRRQETFRSKRPKRSRKYSNQLYLALKTQARKIALSAKLGNQKHLYASPKESDSNAVKQMWIGTNFAF